MIVNLNFAELENSLNFAKKAAFNHNGHPFGTWNQPKRTYEKKVRDIFVGKIGEVAFEYFLIQNEIKAWIKCREILNSIIILRFWLLDWRILWQKQMIRKTVN